MGLCTYLTVVFTDSKASERLARASEEKVRRAAAQVRVRESVDDLTATACGFHLTCEQALAIMNLYALLQA